MHHQTAERRAPDIPSCDWDDVVFGMPCYSISLIYKPCMFLNSPRLPLLYHRRHICGLMPFWTCALGLVFVDWLALVALEWVSGAGPGPRACAAK